MNKHNCRVCGLFSDDLPWGENDDCPTHEICPCCGVEFGYEDYTIPSTKEYRNNWLLKGAEWFDKSEKPDSWDREQQFKNIPEEFK